MPDAVPNGMWPFFVARKKKSTNAEYAMYEMYGKYFCKYWDYCRLLQVLRPTSNHNTAAPAHRGSPGLPLSGCFQKKTHGSESGLGTSCQ